MDERIRNEPYWIGTRVLILFILAVFFACFVTVFIFISQLDRYELFGFPVGYLFVTLGLVLLCIGLVFWFVDRQDRLDHRYRMIEDI